MDSKLQPPHKNVLLNYNNIYKIYQIQNTFKCNKGQKKKAVNLGNERIFKT